MAHKIQFTLIVEKLNSETFAVTTFTYEEGLSMPFCLEANLVSREMDLDQDKIVDSSARLVIWNDGKIVQSIHGIVSRFARGDSNLAFRDYQITVVPELYRLSLRHNCRIFQGKTVQKIIEIILKEMGINHVSFFLTEGRAERDYCVQYRESDLEFVSRLAAEEGIAYTFEHSDRGHRVVFFDNTRSLASLDRPVLYSALGGTLSPTSNVYTFLVQNSIKPTSVFLKDYSFKTPASKLESRSDARGIKATSRNYEFYDYPGKFKFDHIGKVRSRHCLDHLRSDASIGTGESNVALLRSGIKFTLENNPERDLNRDWIITHITHHGKQPQAMQEYADNQPTRYNNTFSVIPSNQTWRPNPISKPRVDGPQIALVTGPKDEEIFCDDFGRVKIKFPWDLEQTKHEKSSCWVRVSQAWAGTQYGIVALPRVGNEVIVSFLEGDPDQPIITGRTFNAVNRFPYPLPKHKTKMVIRTESVNGKGFNELSFEDQKGKEEVFIHSQKDLIFNVQNDHQTLIKSDCLSTIEKNTYTHIIQDSHVTINGEQRVSVSKNHSMTVDGDAHLKVKKTYALESGGDIHIKGEANIVLEAASSISLKVGGSFIVIDSSGVHIVGSTINLNSGGSAESGDGFKGLAPTLPSKKDLLKPDNAHNIPAMNMPQITLNESAASGFPTLPKPRDSRISNDTEKKKDAGKDFDKKQLLFCDAIQKTADKYKVVLGLRFPSPIGQIHLKQNHPSKNFHVKAKSSSSGPTAGFITQKPLYSKIKQTPEGIKKHELNIADSLTKGAKCVPLRLSKAQIKNVLVAGKMREIEHPEYLGMYEANYHGAMVRFRIDVDGDVREHNDGEESPVLVLTNPPEKTQRKTSTAATNDRRPSVVIIEDLNGPITADYDLFAIIPRSNQSANTLPQSTSPRLVRKNQTSESRIQKTVDSLNAPKPNQPPMHPDQGNVHVFGQTIIGDLNKNVAAEGYHGGTLFWHGDENANPYSPGLDLEGDTPLFFIPNEIPRQIFKLYQLQNFYDELKAKGYLPETNSRY